LNLKWSFLADWITNNVQQQASPWGAGAIASSALFTAKNTEEVREFQLDPLKYPPSD
jgi:hypothetical protein